MKKLLFILLLFPSPLWGQMAAPGGIRCGNGGTIIDSIVLDEGLLKYYEGVSLTGKQVYPYGWDLNGVWIDSITESNGVWTWHKGAAISGKAGLTEGIWVGNDDYIIDSVHVEAGNIDSLYIGGASYRIEGNCGPVIENISINGYGVTDSTLTASYDYSDEENDIEGTTTFLWYVNGSPIDSVRQQLVVPSTAEIYYIKVEITPVALTGVLIGDSLISDSIGPITDMYGYGPELVIDGDFNNTVNWIEGINCNVTGSELVCINEPTYNATIPTDAIPVVNGTTYRTSYKIADYTSGTFRFSFVGGGTGAGTQHNAAGTYVEELIPQGSDIKFELASRNLALTADWDSVSVREKLATDYSARTLFFVSTNGHDANPGTIGQPFKTIPYAMAQLTAGDTLYIRGGTYADLNSQDFAYDGVHSLEVFGLLYNLRSTVSDTTLISAYQGETVVWDFSSEPTTGNSKIAVQVDSCLYLKIKGLHIKGMPQMANGSKGMGFWLWESEHIVYENCTAEDMGGHGFTIHGRWWDDPESDYPDDTTITKYIHYINCDGIHNQNYVDGYGDADGFACNWTRLVDSVYYTNCRSWFNSDDGIDLFNLDSCHVFVRGTWIFGNGYENDWTTARGDGQGLKLGPSTTDQSDTLLHIVTNCLFVKNRSSGYDQNTNTFSCVKDAYNNFSYANFYGFIYYNIANDPEDTLCNNIAFDNDHDFVDPAGAVIDTYNSWNGGVTVTRADFASLDSTQLYGSRQADGSLPVVTFGHLQTGSDLIDAGVDVGLPYEGVAPDLGAFEKESAWILFVLVMLLYINKRNRRKFYEHKN